MLHKVVEYDWCSEPVPVGITTSENAFAQFAVDPTTFAPLVHANLSITTSMTAFTGTQNATLRLYLVADPDDSSVPPSGTLLFSATLSANGSITSEGEIDISSITSPGFFRFTVVKGGSGSNPKIAAATIILEGVAFEDPCGPDFFQPDSAEVIAANQVRVRFTLPAKTLLASDADDATNPSNYVLDGPAARSVVLASTVSSDPDCIDLYLDQDLVPGTWSVAVDPDVVSADVPPFQMVAPFTLGFIYATDLNQLPVGQGAENDDCATALLKHFNPAYRGKDRWQGIMAGIAAGDCIVRDIAKKAFDQLFVATASDHYLVTRAADRGIARPEATGMHDDLFRQLVTTVANAKLTAQSFLDMLEVFYGVDAVSAYAETSSIEPFVLRDGSTLQVLMDETLSVDVTFNRADFHILRRASADEVAAVITRALELRGSSGYAVAVNDPETGDRRVRIYSGRRGLRSSVRITLGTAEPFLLFPTIIFPLSDPEPTLPHWTVTKEAYDVMRFAPNDDTVYDLSRVEVGDYVVILGVEFSSENRGTFEISNVFYSYSGSDLTQWFEVVNADGVTESGTITQCFGPSLSFFRRTRRTVYDNPTHAIVSQSGGTALVSIAATTRAVQRGPGTAAYLQSRDAIDITALARLPDGTTTITTDGAHGLSEGDEIWLDEVVPGVPTTPNAGTGTPSGALSSGAASGLSADTVYTKAHRDNTINRVLALGLTDLDGDAVFVGGQSQSNVGVYTTAYTLTGYQVTGVVDTDQARHHAYRWTNADYSALIGGFVSTDETQCFRPLGRAGTVLTNATVRNNLLLTGGYCLSPWQVFQTNNLTNKVFRAVKDETRVGPSFWALSAATAAANRHTDAVLSTVSTTKAVLTGGCTDHNVPSTQVCAYNQSAGSWATLASLKQARSQHQVASLPTAGTALVIGGRQPAILTPTPLTGFTFWNFDEAVASTTFVGPVTVNRNANPRPVGKVGWGAQLTTSMESTGGGAQTTLNTALLSNYTIWGWMTSRQGTVFRNGITGAPAVSLDNTLLAFGVDNTDEKFFLTWQHGTNVVVTKKTALTRPALMPVSHDATYPRYYHFCIVKSVSGANATFKLYINGGLQGTWTDTKPDGGADGSWRFGEAEPGGFSGFSGDVDQVGFKAGTELTAAQVLEAYRAQVGSSYDNPKSIDDQPVGTVLATCEVVDGTTGWLRRAGAMATARFAHGTVVLPDGRIIVCGGVGYNPTTDAFPDARSQRQLELRSAEVFDPATMAWSPLPDMTEAHSYPACGYIAATNRIYVWGGFSSTKVEYLDLRTMRWSVAPTSLSEVRARGAGSYAGDDTIVLMGGGIAATAAGIEQSTAVDYSLDAASDTVRAGGLNQEQRVLSVLSSTILTLKTPEHAGATTATTGTLTPVGAAAGTAPGPFIFDPDSGFGITAVDGTLATRLDAGRTYPSITLGATEAQDFPDETGYLVFNYGYSNQVGPVKYLGWLSSTDLAIDAGFKFPETLPVGTTVTLLFTRSPFVPDNVTDIGAFYLTASPAGRVAAMATLEAISAAGIELEVTVRYPGDRGLGGEGFPDSDNYKLSDIVSVFGGDDLDQELAELRNE